MRNTQVLFPTIPRNWCVKDSCTEYYNIKYKAQHNKAGCSKR